MSAMTEIPLFPLSAVLLPYGRMPLKIFERRYLDLVRECMRHNSGFGVAWIRRGEEVARRGAASPELGDWGCYAHIVDWDQLDNGLLGITIEGRQRFTLESAQVEASGLWRGQVDMQPSPAPVAMQAQWQSLAAVLQSLETHPHVQRMNLNIDYQDIWQVAYTLVQLLPLDEALKYELLGMEQLESLLAELDRLLNQISGEE